MEDPLENTDSSTQDVANVIRTRGRQVDIHKYIKTHPEELVKGVLIAGSIGSGKSQRAMQVIQAALESDYGVLIFDPSGDHRRLVSVCEDAVVLDYREFIMNPLEPPLGMGLDDWAPTFIQVFAQNYGLKDPSIAILQKGMNELISTTQSKDDLSPTLEELLQEVRQYKPRERSSESSSHASVQNRLESLLGSEIGRSVSVRQGFQPDEFESGLLVIQLPSSGLTRAHELLVGITIAKLFAYRAWRKMQSDEKDSKLLIVIEEAHNYLSEARRDDRRGERSQLERSLIEGRKLDIGFLIIDQLPQRISSHVLGSCNMWIVGKLMDPEAKKVIGEALCLDAVWSRDGLISLPTGGAFIRVEHTKELEKQSPLVHWKTSEEKLVGVSNLPAIVAVPLEEELLVSDVPYSHVKNLMSVNIRYMQYFKRYASQYIEKKREIFPDYAIRLLEQFITHINTPTENQEMSFFEYTGLTSGDIETLRKKDQSETVSSPTMSLRSRIHDLEIRCGILSSDVNQLILTSLYSNSPQGMTEFNIITGKSKSWLSRILTELQSRGYIRKQQGMSKYLLTDYGCEVLHWARVVVSLWNSNDIVERSSSIVYLAKKDFDWLLNHCTDELEVRENAYLAGWLGHEEVRSNLQNLIFRAQTLAGIKNPEIIIDRLTLDSKVFKTLKSSIESHIIRILLSSMKNTPITDIPALCNLSDRSVRRHLSILEKHRVVSRHRNTTGWSVCISDSWTNLLLDDCDISKKQIRLTSNLLESIIRHAIDSVLLEMFIENHKDTESLNYVILKSLEILSIS